MKHLLLGFFFMVSLATAASAQVRVNASAVAERIDIRVYPNPAESYLEVNDNDRVSQVAIFNLAGRQVKEFQYIKGERFYVGDLPRGMYLVQLYDARRKTITTQRINKL
jgi:hypothetical protein